MNKDTALICVCSPEYLNQYRVLYKSIKVHVPDVSTVLYYGGEDTPTDVGEVVNVSSWVKESAYTDPLYTYCSMRPRAILDAFNKFDRIILLGADTEFFSYPSECFTAHEAFVTMYIHEPYRGDQTLYGNNLQVLENGQINADLIGFRKTSKVLQFVEWVYEQTKTQCKIGEKEYVDQVWFSMIFSFLDTVNIIRHPGYNVAHYNMYQRGLQITESKHQMSNGQPLVLFHYAGFVKGQEETISKHQNRYRAEGDILKFLKTYGEKI